MPLCYRTLVRHVLYFQLSIAFYSLMQKKTFTEHVKTKEKHIKIASNCYYGIWLRLVEFLIRYKWILPGLIYYFINTMLFIIYDVVYTEQLIENQQRETKAFI